MSTPIIIIDSRVSGFESSPMRVLSVCMPTSGRIIVQKVAPYHEKIVKKENLLLVTDSPSHFDSWQLAFHEKQHLEEAVATFFDRMRSGKVKINSAVEKFDPQSIMELRKVDKTGAVHEINSSEITNAHMAVLLAVWASAKASMGYLLSNSDESELSEDDSDDPMMPYSM